MKEVGTGTELAELGRYVRRVCYKVICRKKRESTETTRKSKTNEFKLIENQELKK